MHVNTPAYTPHTCIGALSRSANLYARIEVGDQQHLSGLSHNVFSGNTQFSIDVRADVVREGGGRRSCVPPVVQLPRVFFFPPPSQVVTAGSPRCWQTHHCWLHHKPVFLSCLRQFLPKAACTSRLKRTDTYPSAPSLEPSRYSYLKVEACRGCFR